MRCVVLATFGSLGDLHPFIALGQALREQALDVVVASAAEYQPKVQAAGLKFHPLRPSLADMERDLGMSREQITQQALARSDFLFRRLLLPYVRAAFEDVMACTETADLLLTSSLAFAARLAAEKRALPQLTVVLQPMMFFSAYDPAALPGMPWLRPLLRALGPVATRALWWSLKCASEPLFAPLRKVRAALDLPPQRDHPLIGGQFTSTGALALYSPLLGSAQPDYPRSTAIVGFAGFDSEDGATPALAPGLEKFLHGAEPPIVFTLGSVVVHASGNFYCASAAASAALGRRAVLLVGDRLADFAYLASPSIYVCGYVPHSLLFARSAAIVHHGGIGTLAQALRAGKPQLIVPHFADQMDNAWRARRLGVAAILSPARYSARRAAQRLERVLGAAGYAERALALGARVAAENGAANAAAVILDRFAQLRRQ